MFGGRKAWCDLKPGERAAIVLAGVIQIALQAGALLDLRRRADAELNGSKRVWVLLSFVNFLGPIAYFLAGRRRTIGVGLGSSR
jgi:hypothetical protein